MTVKQTVEIKNKLGMHARPAMKLFELVQSFDAEVMLRNDSGTEAEASSVIALLMLDSAKGRQIEVEATGLMKFRHWQRLSSCLIRDLTKIKGARSVGNRLLSTKKTIFTPCREIRREYNSPQFAGGNDEKPPIFC